MEARLEDVGSGLTPVSPGWFVVNVAEAAWLRNDAFGGRCVFESNGRVLAERPDLEPRQFEQLGFTLAVLEPGKPTGMYHAESDQEDFLVLAGTCLLIVEEEERELRAWDFVHCPPGTRHTFVGTGEGPCVIFMTGARPTRPARARRTRRSPTGASAGQLRGASCLGARNELGQSLLAVALLVFLVPLGLVGLRLGELLLRQRLAAGRMLAGVRLAAGGHEADEEERHGDHAEDEPRKHAAQRT
jgi:quercetin dioxygenase-like cupin family protein